jgi:glucose-1-phosphate cytidylyltransferase
MIQIGGNPILWHIMRTYARFGFRRFVLCLGYKAEVIKQYFLTYSALRSDFTVDLATSDVQTHSVDHSDDWQVTLASTGELTMTGGRVARAAERYLYDAEHFAVTYGDGLTNAHLGTEFRFHIEHGRLATVLGVNPPSRFGELRLDGDRVAEFQEKPVFDDAWINGGYFFFRREALAYLSSDESCVLEQAPLAKLAADDQLSIYRHSGFWKCMDTQRDYDQLHQMCERGDMPWSRSAIASSM